MKHVVAPVKNIRRLVEAGNALTTRSSGVPGIGLIWGASGYGKTTAAAWASNQLNAICVRANATWTRRSMLSKLMLELSAQPRGSAAQMFEFVVDALMAKRRPLFIDEADYLVNERLLETVRDIHDVSETPVVLIGMADFRRRVMHRDQLKNRIAQWVEFKPADFEDTKTLAAHCCEVTVADDLLHHVHTHTSGVVREIRVALERIDVFGRRQELSKVTLKDWGRQELTLSEQVGLN